MHRRSSCGSSQAYFYCSRMTSTISSTSTSNICSGPHQWTEALAHISSKQTQTHTAVAISCSPQQPTAALGTIAPAGAIEAAVSMDIVPDRYLQQQQPEQQLRAAAPSSSKHQEPTSATNSSSPQQQLRQLSVAAHSGNPQWQQQKQKQKQEQCSQQVQ